MIACTKKEGAKLVAPVTTQSTNKLLDKTWYLYSRNNKLTNNKFTTRDYQSDGQLVADIGSSSYSTTDYWTFKYQNSGLFSNDTIISINDTSFFIRSWQPAMGTYVDYYKLK